MRKFSDWEKDIIRRIASLASGNFTFDAFVLFSDVFIDEKFFIDSCPFAMWYNPAKIKHEDLIAEKRKIFDLVFLLDYLERNRYIILHGHYDKDYGKSQKHYINVELNAWMAKTLYGCISSCIYVTQDLFSLVENDFKEYEEIALEEAKKQTNEAKKQSKSAKWSVIISAIAVVVALLTMILSICL